MHNTKSAVANLINRYMAVLKKCHLLNMFGSLALAMSLVCGGAGIACAATDSAYILEGDINNVYTQFKDYSVITSTDTPSKYVLDEKQYGVKLKNSDYSNVNTNATSETVKLLIQNYLTTQSPTVTSSAYTEIESPTIVTTGVGVGDITINTENIFYAVKNSGASPSATGSRNIITTTGDYTGNYIDIVNGSGADIATAGSGPWKSFNGGAVSVAIQENKSLSGISITGDFIDNSIKDLTSYTAAGQDTSKNSVFKNNGGAIGLFTNVSGASIEVTTIKGDFIGNEAHRVGGAIYLFTNNNSTTKVDTITGNFIDNIAGSGGGAIANYEGEIVKIDGTFIGNVATAGGGAAIDNMMWSKVGDHKAKIGDIAGTFIGNRTGDSTTKGDGGAIRNFAYSYSGTTTTNGYASIGNITANFIGNEASGDGGALYNYAHSKDTVASVGGGEVSNTASINSISGDFIGNIAGGSGGAIYNDDNLESTASIGKITGDFISNVSQLYGGAMYNASIIGVVGLASIEGDFINNTVGNDTADKAIGGAIYNNANSRQALIGNIEGDFIGNKATAKQGLGGAIANYSAVTGKKATIGNIEGDFISNSATKYGGAIYNDSNSVGDSEIGNITGNFLYNSVIALATTPVSVKGGAIYNNDTIGNIEGSFIGNYVKGELDNDVAGGAVFTTSNMDFIATNQTHYFSDNYTQKGTASLDYNAIYVGIDTIISTGASTSNIGLNFTMSGSGNFVMNDSISGNTMYTPLTIKHYTGASAALSGNTITINDGSSTKIAQLAGTLRSSTVTTKTYTKSVTNSDTSTVTTTVTEVTDGGTTTYTKKTVTEYNGSIVSTETGSATASDIASLTPTSSVTVETATVTDGNDEATYVKTTEGSQTTTTATVSTVVNKGAANETSTKTTLGSDGAAQKNEYAEAELMTGDTAYDINITGDSKDNTFYLRDEVTNFGQFSIQNATLHLGAYTHADGTTTTKGSLTALDDKSSVTFGVNSQLTIDMSAYPDAVKQNGNIGTAVLQGNGAGLTIHDRSKLNLLNAHNGDTFTILSGFKVANATDIQQDATGNYAWTIDNVSVDSDLLAITILRDGYDDIKDTSNFSDTDVYYVISVVKSDDSPLFDTSVGDIVSSAAKDTLFGSDSAAAGDRYYYDISTIPDEHDEKTAAEGTANMAKVSGVPTTTFRVNRLSSDALSSRGDFGGGAEAGGVAELSKKNESTALWAIPMYGHDVTDGASVAGYGADYHTNIYGGVVGIDKTIDNAGANALGADQYRVGVALNMGGGDTKSSGHFSNVNSDFNFGGAFVYGIAKYGDFTLRADAGFNKIFSEMNQDLSDHGIAGSKADVESSAWSIDLSGEYRIATDVVDITPYVGLELVSMKTEDYAVKRSDAAGGTLYNIESDRQNIVSVPVGVKFDAEWAMQDSWTLTPQLSIGAIFAMGDLDEHSFIRMPDVAGSGQTSIQVVDEVTLDMAVGVCIANDVWTIGLDYELQKSEHRTGHGLTGLVQYKF